MSEPSKPSRLHVTGEERNSSHGLKRRLVSRFSDVEFKYVLGLLLRVLGLAPWEPLILEVLLAWF